MSQPRIVDAIVSALLERSPRSSGDLAREFLNLGPLDERAADMLIRPLLREDERVGENDSGWVAAERPHPSDSENDPPLASTFAVVCAPRAIPEAAHAAVAGAVKEPRPDLFSCRYTVSLGGEREVRRYEARTGRAMTRPVVDLTCVARRLFGYRGSADAERIASWIGISHVAETTLDGAARLAGETWEAMIDDCAGMDVAGIAGLARALDERLHVPDLESRAFGQEALDALSMGPGCYVFRDADDEVLYVGRASRLALRVLSYFTGPPRDEKDMALRARAHDLEIRETPSLPDAMHLEARLIDRLAPAFNRRRESASPAGRTEPRDGIVLAPVVARDGSTSREKIAFTIGGGAVVARTRLAPGPKRAEKRARQAAAPLFDESARPEGLDPSDARRLALTIASWCAGDRRGVHLEPGLDGGEEMIVGRLVAAVRSDE